MLDNLSHMENVKKNLMTVEHHCIDAQYVHLRCHKPSARAKITSSIEQNGQLMPVIIIPDSENQWTLIDGHLRVKALKCLGIDTVEAEIWQCDATEALLTIIKSHSGRPLDVFEESLLIKELHTKHGLTQDALSKRIGRDPSWVSRRLSLIEFLSDDILQILSNGEISLWVAGRILAPMARANLDHAQVLLNYLRKNFHSTRELAEFYKHYTCCNHQERVNMVNKPGIFFKAQKILTADKQSSLLKDGPEGQWKYKLSTVTTLLSELLLLAPTILYPRQEPENAQELVQKFNQAKVHFDTLNKKLGSLTNARQGNTSDNNTA
jgi:ParB/RepB/Spo0J family partition protein